MSLEALAAADHAAGAGRADAPAARQGGGAAPGRRRGPAGTRPARRALHGVLLVDKPVGWTSQDVLAKLKGAMRAEKAGHTGTLDPLASGLLPICFGAATKFAQVSLDADKAYRATLQLGCTRVGGDREGEVLRERPVNVDAAQLHAVLARFTGSIEQVPPMHSALKHEGRALYTYARAGVEVERVPRRVSIHALSLVGLAGAELIIDVRCSKGTYIRTLAEDIGEALGCGAHLAALRRTASGPLRLDDAAPLDSLLAMDAAGRDARLLPVDALLREWPLVRLPAEEAGRFLSGLRRRVALPDATQVRVYGPEPLAFLGSAHVTAGELIADRLLSPPEVQALLAGPPLAGAAASDTVTERP